MKIDFLLSFSKQELHAQLWSGTHLGTVVVPGRKAFNQLNQDTTLRRMQNKRKTRTKSNKKNGEVKEIESRE